MSERQMFRIPEGSNQMFRTSAAGFPVGLEASPL